MLTLVLSDIHGNLSALKTVLQRVEKYEIDSCILLGDVIDYGMHSNEVIEELRILPYPILCNIWGNHEKAICQEEYERFSSERGKQCAAYTKSILTADSQTYIQTEMIAEGWKEFIFAGKNCLAVHGSWEDIYWKSIDITKELAEYEKYDYVFSGHSHLPYCVEKYYSVENAVMRNRKKVIFINPGSVGQPRNQNNMAQYALVDLESETIMLEKAAYDIAREQAAYAGQVDEFYKQRLELGI